MYAFPHTGLMFFLNTEHCTGKLCSKCIYTTISNLILMNMIIYSFPA